jgi:hypothetical protein
MDIDIPAIWAKAKPFVTSQIRHLMGALAASIGTFGLLKDPGSQAQFVDIGTAIALYGITSAWSWWNASGRALFKAQMEIIQAKTLAQAQALRQAGLPMVTVKQIAQQSSTMTLAETAKVIPTLPTEIQSNISGPSPASISKIVAAVVVLILGSMLMPSDASAQNRRNAPALTGDPLNDIKTDLNNAGIKTPPATVAGAACDFNIFAALTPSNVITTIKNCVSDVNKPFLPDVQDALDSATAYKDKPAVDCLTPALAIVQAAVGKPGVPGKAAVIAPDGTVTAAAVPDQPAVMSGIILIFQKFREFTLANGPSACKNWVKSTINGAVAGAT